MPIFLSLLGRFWYVIVIALLIAYCDWLRHDVKNAKHETEIVRTQFDAFQNQVAAAGLKAEQDKLAKEKDYATNIANANAGRVAALNELQRAQAAASAGRRASASNPVAPAGSNYVCIESKAYDAAFQQFGKRIDEFLPAVRSLVVEGDKAQIDAQSMIRAWPTDKQVEWVKPKEAAK